ncbi:MAG: hypothetical protein M3303_07635, partial [Gemmatimonadota bacterium]|nr:hypothetical protein [Gemmatimonadota bacterium]
MDRFIAWTCCLALVLGAACAAPRGEPNGPKTTTSLEPGEAIDAEYGALAPRLVALDAFGGRRDLVRLRMTRHTIEGARIVEELSVDAGKAVLSIDERADGGGVRRYTLSNLQLVRYEPARWEGNVEIEKERFVAVSAAAAAATPGVYLLAHPKCLGA